MYNGIVLPDKWPPRIDAMFPGPTTTPYLKNPPAAIRIDVGRQLFVDDFLVASSEGVVRKFYKPVKFEGNPVLWPETDEELARWTELRDKEFYYILTAGEDEEAIMQRSLECFRGFADCFRGSTEKGAILAHGLYEKNDAKGSPFEAQAYEMGKGI